MSLEHLRQSDKNPFYVRAKEVLMGEKEYKERKLDNDHLLIMDTRGKMYRLAGMSGEFMRDPKYNAEYPILMVIKENQDHEFDIVGIVNKPSELPYEDKDKEIKNAKGDGK